MQYSSPRVSAKIGVKEPLRKKDGRAKVLANANLSKKLVVHGRVHVFNSCFYYITQGCCDTDFTGKLVSSGVLEDVNKMIANG